MTMLLLNVFGGLAIFIFGMQLMSDGLHQVAGERMRSVLRLFSANRYVGVLSGAVVTTVIQSSSASTVMVIGFVNAGLLTLTQAMGIIFGANIGTTVTAQLVAFDIQWIIMPSIILGLLLSFMPKKSIANWSATVIGFGFLFLGMTLMSGELKALAENEAFKSIFQIFPCAPVNGVMPVSGVLGALLVGIIATLVIQSSSACTGIIIALAASGLLDLYTGVVLALGSNIGTTITAQLAAIPANRVAKQTALAHTLFNVIGCLIVSVSFWITWDKIPVFFQLVERISADGSLARQVANAHTLFNVCTTLILLPFIPLLATVCEKVLPLKDKKTKYQRLEPRLLDTPSIALAQTTSAIRKMLKKAWKMVDGTLRMYNRNDEKTQKLLSQLDKREEDVDARQKDITGYLSLLMQHPLTADEAKQIPILLHCTNDVERIGDHAFVIRTVMERIATSGCKFSDSV
ncbi:MAG: Na/Pi cotransporter family protein, partial [Lentisphaeria bacterium]|nr:Na/Pi cotransporter family protein [Lentisphaeria bacterium]